MVRWVWVMKKPQVPLAQGLHVLANPIMKHNLGTKINFDQKNVEGDIYVSERTIKGIKEELFRKFKKDKKLPDKLKKKVDRVILEMLNTRQQLIKLDIKRQSNKELIDNFIKGYNSIAKVTSFMSFKGTVQLSDIIEDEFRDVLKKKSSSREEQDNLFLLFSIPLKDSYMALETKSMLEIGLCKQTGKDFSKMISRHKEKFAWMGCVMYKGLPFGMQHYLYELNEMAKRDCKSILAHNKQMKKRRENAIRNKTKELKFNNNEHRLLRQLREWVHLRTYIKDSTSIGMEPTINILMELSSRLNFGYDDLLYLKYEDLITFKLKKNNRRWGYILKNGKARYFYGDKVSLIEEKREDMPNFVKGFVACKGHAKGLAIVVKSDADLDTIEEGSILITHMTTTNFVPKLMKVSAIITDEGGITCHAAIISRELNIPCIIGTRIATKAFRSGDIVEVDAENGIVRLAR